MHANVEYLLQDSKTLIKTVDENRTRMAAKGFTDATYTSLTESLTNLQAKSLAQQNAQKLVTETTTLQNEVMGRVGDMVMKIKNAAKAAYGRNPRELKLFKVGDRLPSSVNQMRALCEYIAVLALERSAELLQNGLLQDDIDALNGAVGRLAAADANQEHAKKLQKQATQMRNEAASDLREKLGRVRNFANACFAEDKDTLIMFKPIARGRGAAPEETPPEGQNPPEQPPGS